MIRNKILKLRKKIQTDNIEQIDIFQDENYFNKNTIYPKLKDNFTPSNLLKIDKSIRFVGICTTEGVLLEAEYSDEIIPLISDESLQIAVRKTALKHSLRTDDEEKIGKIQYSVTSYENVKRLTIPFDKDLLLLISFERKKDESELIKKIQNSVLLLQ